MIRGIHHVTALTGNIRKNIRFYTEILGLCFVKKTINFDSPDTWHFFYGDKTGSPGTVISFMPQVNLQRGQVGVGSTKVTGFSVCDSSLVFWKKRLREYQVDFRGPFQRFNESYYAFFDPDGLELELVGTNNDQRMGAETPGISSENAIKGLYQVELTCSVSDKTAYFLTSVLSLSRFKEENHRIRLYSAAALPGCFVDLVSRPTLPLHKSGVGTVHYLGLSVSGEESLRQVKERVGKTGIQVSSVVDRHYFKSIFFREPGGVMLEISTSDPGFLIDEDPGSLGQSLKLPPWMETEKQRIESALPSLD
ncbi:MAG TPA: VOC family protein [Bacteroidales bacterium]|nr:VOC family protein [Bacteroidales bacterium]